MTEGIPAGIVYGRIDAYTKKLIALTCAILEQELEPEQSSPLKLKFKMAVWEERDRLLHLLGLARKPISEEENPADGNPGCDPAAADAVAAR